MSRLSSLWTQSLVFFPRESALRPQLRRKKRDDDEDDDSPPVDSGGLQEVIKLALALFTLTLVFVGIYYSGWIPNSTPGSTATITSFVTSTTVSTTTAVSTSIRVTATTTTTVTTTTQIVNPATSPTYRVTGHLNASSLFPATGIEFRPPNGVPKPPVAWKDGNFNATLISGVLYQVYLDYNFLWVFPSAQLCGQVRQTPTQGTSPLTLNLRC